MELIWSRRFKKDVSKLSYSVGKKMMERIDLLMDNPHHPLLNNHKLNPPLDGYRSINITGDIRLVFQDTGSSYILARVGSHSELYE